MATRRSVLGDAHVDRAEAAKTDFDEPFQELITEAAWGYVWSRANIYQARALDDHHRAACSPRPRRGGGDACARHANTGATRDDIREALLHVAIYAGVPAANRAIKIAKKTFAEMDAEAGKP